MNRLHRRCSTSAHAAGANAAQARTSTGCLVEVTAASNVLGTKPPLRRIADRAHEVGALVYADGVHYAEHHLVDVPALGADLFACSPSKFLGPHCGVLAAAPELLETLRPDKLVPSPDTVPERFEFGTLPYEILTGATAVVDFLASMDPGTGTPDDPRRSERARGPGTPGRAQRAGTRRIVLRPVVDSPDLARAVARLHTAVVENAPRLVVEERLTAAVLALSRDAAARPVRPPDRPGRVDPAALATARDLLRQRFAENIAADELARAAGCSRFALYRVFRAAYGFAPSDYRRDLRLRRARALMAEGTAPSTAAAEAGFADQAHLTRWFTRIYGVTPAAYRTAPHTGRAQYTSRT